LTKTIRISYGGDQCTITDANDKVWTITMRVEGDKIIGSTVGAPPTDDEAKPLLAAIKLWIYQGCVVDAAGACQWRAETQREAPTGREEKIHVQSHH